MSKRKVAVALSGWLLDEVDAAAEQRLMSRSALVEEALAKYVVHRRVTQDEERFRREATLALEDMQAFAREYHSDPDSALEPSSLEKLRALRADGRGVNR